ncbi:MAG: hypothetical protein J5I50_08145 [Chitinophagaceae bacterium]|nr:hypothetical protein [Chitinophagaceae bacterium]
MKRFFYTVLFSLGILLPVLMAAQAPSVTVSVNKTNILIGEQIAFKVELRMPDNTYRLNWFTVPDDFGGFVVASRDKIDSTFADGILGFSQTLYITSFDSGRQVIPPLTLNLTNYKVDSAFIMLTDSIVVNVGYSPDDNVLPFHDIKPIITVDYKNQWWFWPGIALGALILLFIFYRLFRRKKKSALEAEPPIPDYDEAIMLLDRLKKESLPEKGKAKQYYVRLTDIFKRYLSRGTRVYKMQLTGEELIQEVHTLLPDKKAVASFAECIRKADAVKFAKWNTSVQDCAQSMTVIRQTIEMLHAMKKEGRDDI